MWKGPNPKMTDVLMRRINWDKMTQTQGQPEETAARRPCTSPREATQQKPNLAKPFA
jgi:hypothetical protein